MRPHARVAAAVLFALTAAAPLQLAAARQPAIEPAAVLTLPDDDRGRCIRAFIDTTNQPTAERVAAFESDHASTKRRADRPTAAVLRTMTDLHDRWGGARLDRVLVVGQSVISVMVAPSRGETVAIEFEFSGLETGKLDSVLIAPAREAAVSQPLKPEARAAAVDRAASLLDKNYVFPETAAKMAALVRKNLESGEYDAIVDEVGLARRLTTDFRSVSDDKHLRVRLEPAPDTDAERSTMEPEAPPPLPRIGGDNNGFRRIEVLDGNVGYLRFDGFVGSDSARDTAASAMAFVAHADAVIFDLRNNGGGSPEMVRFMCSYLFDERTHLNDLLDRKGNVVREFWTLDELPGRRLGAKVPVYVLTSSYTFSGAEEFAYNLKCLKRATIVGETTDGGAHPVRPFRIDDRFVIGVPYMRARNPITQTNWEGTGVEPDIKCGAVEALDRALEHARRESQ